jgi:hypothetical protein
MIDIDILKRMSGCLPSGRIRHEPFKVMVRFPLPVNYFGQTVFVSASILTMKLTVFSSLLSLFVRADFFSYQYETHYVSYQKKCHFVSLFFFLFFYVKFRFVSIKKKKKNSVNYQLITINYKVF